MLNFILVMAILGLVGYIAFFSRLKKFVCEKVLSLFGNPAATPKGMDKKLDEVIDLLKVLVNK